MKPGMKPDNFQQIYEKGMKPGMKPRYETGLSKRNPHTDFGFPTKIILNPREGRRLDTERHYVWAKALDGIWPLGHACAVLC